MERLNRIVRLIALVFVIYLPLSACAFASWEQDGSPICAVERNQEFTEITSDGLGGAIITWRDLRSGSYDIYVQRVDASGIELWTVDGTAICTAAGSQFDPQLISDGASGAIMTWEDKRTGIYDIYAQRVDSSGTALWTVGGVAICTATDSQYDPQLISDGASGAIITWEDRRDGNYDIYAQRVDSLGTALWTANGVSVTVAAGDQRYPQIASDGVGGGVITWRDNRSSVYDIYAQRVDTAGSVLWVADGVAICSATGSQYDPQIGSDGAGGAIIAWEDKRSGIYDIYAQRVDSTGAALWTADGIAICTAMSSQYDPEVISDGAEGGIITWRDYRGGSYDIYAQRADSLGTALWVADGVAICTATNSQFDPQIISDGAGGAIVTWEDKRSGVHDIYAQRVDASGAVLWAADGTAICTAADEQYDPRITLDGMGGAIITWRDYRSGTNYDIYAHRVSAGGITDLTFASVSATVGRGHVTLSWHMAVDVPASSFLIERSESWGGEFLALDVFIFKGPGFSFYCTDYAVVPGRSYWYRIVLMSAFGVEVFGPLEVYVEATPVSCRVHQSYPNPFNPICTIRYEIPEAGKVSLKVFDPSGSLVKTLVDGWREPGAYSEFWDGRGEDGRELPSGVYFYCLEAGKFIATRKAVLLR